MALNRHSRFLDLLRAAAIALVLLRHGVAVPPIAAQPQASSGVSTWFDHVAQNGWLGVDLFFVLSGYLLCSQILHDVDQDRWRPRNFYLRRAVRILPAYLAMLMLCWVGALVPILGTNGVLDPAVLATHLLFLQDYAGAQLMVTLWSLATEEKFYLLLPVLVIPLARTSRGGAALAFACASLAVAVLRTLAINDTPPLGYSEFFWSFRAPFHFASDGLLIGTAIGFAEQCLPVKAKHSRKFFLGLAIAAAVGAGLILFSPAWLAASFAPTSIAIWAFSACCGALLLFGRASGIEKPTPSTPNAISWLATLSYSLYLTHYPVAVLAKGLFPSETNGIAFWTFYLALSLASAWMLNRLVERPFLNLRQRLRSNAMPPLSSKPHQITSAV